jgi:hypothetical protein
MLQQELFPLLESVVGTLSAPMRLLASVISMAPLEAALSARRSATGRPAKDRAALATAFIAKAVLNIPTTRDLIARVRVDESLRQFCGWRGVNAVPHESKFSRAFAEFAETGLPQRLHEAVIAATQNDRLVGHIARDSTAIPARERMSEDLRRAKADDAKEKRKDRKRKKAARTKEKKKELEARQKAKQPKPAAAGRQETKKHKKHVFALAKAAERGTRIQRQRHQKLDQMLKDLPGQCDIGTKTNSQGNEHSWCGYKLHLDVADGQIPISAVLTSASVHDSQVAIPLMTMTSGRVVYLYDVMDSAYDADSIHEHSRELGHVPIIAPHSRRGTKKPSQLPKVFPDKPTPQLTWAQQERFKERTMIERVNGRLKDEFGARFLRVRGAAKVMAHLMFGVLALTVDQWVRLSAPD